MSMLYDLWHSWVFRCACIEFANCEPTDNAVDPCLYREENDVQSSENVIPVLSEGRENSVEVVDAVVALVLRLMDADRKVTPLKQLQGDVWMHGYASGELRGEVFDDIPEVLQACAARGIPVYIYSSGSVPAQRLLLGYSTAGDLNSYVAGNFDTTTGVWLYGQCQCRSLRVGVWLLNVLVYPFCREQERKGIVCEDCDSCGKSGVQVCVCDRHLRRGRGSIGRGNEGRVE